MGQSGPRVALIVPRTPPMRSRPALAKLWAESPRLRNSVFHTPLPSLSLLSLAGHTPENFRLRYLDENLRGLPERIDCDIAAISSITCQAPRAYALASHFRGQGSHVVMGGVHATILPAEAAEHADTVIVGEAGGLWEQFLEDWVRSRPGRFYRPGQGKGCAADRSPGYHLLQPSRYGTVPVQIGSGCPWNCEYCSVAALHGGRYRRRRLSRVLEEVWLIIKQWRGRPLRIFFIDDRLRFRGEYMGRLLDQLASRKVEWMAQADLGALGSEKTVRRVARAGCRRLLVSVDPGSVRADGSRNRADGCEEVLGRCDEALRRVRRHGMDLSLMFMIGGDGDSPDLYRQLEEFLRRSRVSDVLVAIQTPLPGTKLFRRLRKQGRLLPDRGWSRFNLFNVVYTPSGLSPRQVAAAQTRLLRSVYGKKNRQSGHG